MVEGINYVQDNSYLLDIEVTYEIVESNKNKTWILQIQNYIL